MAHDPPAEHRDPYADNALHAAHAQAHNAHADHGGLGKYVYVFLALCVLSSMSFFTYTDWWQNNMGRHTGWAFMMAVSCGKAMLVVLFFMHVKYEASWKYVLTIPASIMAIFLGLALVPDVGLRQRQYSDERLEFSAEPAPAEHAAAADHADH